MKDVRRKSALTNWQSDQEAYHSDVHPDHACDHRKWRRVEVRHVHPQKTDRTFVFGLPDVKVLLPDGNLPG